MCIVFSLLSIVIVVVLLFVLVVVDEFIGMLKKIKDIGIIIFGYCDVLIFFFYFGIELGKLIGYFYDL